MVRLLFIILLILTTACSRGSDSKKRETRIEEQQIQVILDNQNFECASLGGPCPEGIARMFMIDLENPELSAVCTGFMVSPNRLVTNHHCVPDAEICRNTYIAIYNGTSYEKTRCRSIIRSVQDVDDPNDPRRKLDYTIMEVANPYRGQFFGLSATNAQAFDEIHTWVIDHTGLDDFPANLFNSRITELECEVMDQAERASLMLMRCPIITGNSGSPALNRNGEVVGVIWGGSMGGVDSSIDLEIRRQLEEVGLATEVNYFRDAAE